jgi:hypothetical protein
MLLLGYWHRSGQGCGFDQKTITNYQLPNGLIKVRRRWGQRHPQGANSGSNGKLKLMRNSKQLPPAHPYPITVVLASSVLLIAAEVLMSHCTSSFWLRSRTSSSAARTDVGPAAALYVLLLLEVH